MYRINKDKGNNQNITLTNVETKASVIIGKLTMGIMGILEKEVEFDETKEHTIKLTSQYQMRQEKNWLKWLAQLKDQ